MPRLRASVEGCRATTASEPAAAPAKAAAVATKCPGCFQPIQVPSSFVGKAVKCPSCGHAWRVPGIGGVVDAEAMPEPSGSGGSSNSFDNGMSDTYQLATPKGQAAAGGAGPPGSEYWNKPPQPQDARGGLVPSAAR